MRKRSASRSRAPVACASLVWLAAFLQRSPGEVPWFVIRPARAIQGIEVRYSVAGAFGGYVSPVGKPANDGGFRIPLVIEHKPAKSLNVIVYAPGCEFSRFSADLAATRSRSAAFQCEPPRTG